ncbi:phosphatase PAP2 family protein [soil metagenome]
MAPYGLRAGGILRYPLSILKHRFRKFVDYMAGHGAQVLAAMLLIVIGTWIFVLMTDLVRNGKTDNFDRRVIHYFRWHKRPRVLEDFASDITALGGPGCWMLITMMISGYLAMQRRWRMALWLLATVSSGAIVTIFLKGSIDRVSPGHPAWLPASGSYTSYPSGHSMMAAMVYLTLGSILAQLANGRLTKLYILLMAALVAFLVGATRVYLCIHWPTDVLAGWAAGLVWALLCWVVTERLRQIRQKRKLQQRVVL